MKISKDNAGWIFCCVLLLMALGFSVYLGLSGWYFQNEAKYASDFLLGDARVVEIVPNGAQSLSLGIDSSYLPGEQLPQIIGIKNVDNEREIFVRAKAYAVCDDVCVIKVQSTSNWKYNQEDGYYYLEQPLLAQEKVGFCSHLFAVNSQSFQSNEKYIITILFECIDSGQDITNLWGINR